MSNNYQTPGVYVEEISKLPASVAQVQTAIPAFIGYTAMNPGVNQAYVINSIREYEELFGGPQQESYDVVVEDTTDGNGVLSSRSVSVTPSTSVIGDMHSLYKMYYSLQLFFQNGGGKCYVISIGDYSTTPNRDHFMDGLSELEKEDEPTLIIFPDATSLGISQDYYDVAQQALSQASILGDRFVLVDVFDDGNDNTNNVDEMRGQIGTSNLKYGAVYYPNLQTNTSYAYEETGVTITHTIDAQAGDLPSSFADVDSVDNELYNQIRQRLDSFRVILPPSGIVAGIYARVDRTRGVWKAPANESINGVVGPVLKINNAEQDGLNVDPIGGKSINAIRTFTGKGILVWGARTLDGNSNEWRFISVRRLYNMVEESLRKSTSWAVFEANSAHTWIRIKSMIRNYLTELWKQGALAGGTPDQAFFVNVGLGETMTSVDILEGRMNIEVGMAAVRPAEFIVLKFSHKLQE
ncbi:MAG: phage tail sheath C-terminal domain-containing protein [Bacteroidota bacterium]